MRVVLDCNVVIAAARTDGLCRAALLTAVRHHQVVLSEPITREYRTVGARPKHRAYHATMQAITDLLEKVAIAVEPAKHSITLEDSDDEVYLGTALAGDAEILITGNVRHFPFPRYGAVQILTPSEFQARYG